MSGLEESAAGAAHRPGLLARMLGALTPRKRADAPPARSAHDFAFDSIDGAPLPLAAFRGKAVLVVNTASECGFTAQYAGLQHLHATYRARGLVVLGVPSNDFGGQEPGGNAEIKAFCRSHFGVDFPMTGKTRVIGPDAHPFYRWAAQELGPAARPRWNFHKYLLAADGRLADWFSTVTAPSAGRLIAGIERVLPS